MQHFQHTVGGSRPNRVAEFGLGCEYIREKKKRGKASRKELAERAAAQAAVTSHPAGDISDELESGRSPLTDDKADGLLDHSQSDSISSNGLTAMHENVINENTAIDSEFHPGQPPPAAGQFGDLSAQPHIQHSIQIASDGINGGRPMSIGGYGSLSTSYDRQSMGSDDLMGAGQGYGHPHQSNIPDYSEMTFDMMGQSPTDFNSAAGFRINNSPFSGYQLASATSPGWTMPMSSPSGQFQPQIQSTSFGPSVLRYPVLQPLLSHLSNLVPIQLACDLIDFYFASSTSAAIHPMSPYILGSVFRRQAILHPTKPRKCQPALLASMLWVAAQTSEASLLTSVPSARGKICQQLLELTVGLLKPLVHISSSHISSNMNQAGGDVSLGGGLGTVLPGSLSIDGALTGETGALGASGQLDDLVTYIHLATVISASEYKGASLRWWNVAWSMARELKLGRELPQSEPRPRLDQSEMDTDGLDEHYRLRNNGGFVTEEEKEERRRVWWLVYSVDRHLALCYNRPLFLLDVECEGLRQPLDDAAWQSGDFNYSSADTSILMRIISETKEVGQHTLKGPQFECRGYSMFGYFLPLMTILGEIVDLQHARNHPRFGSTFQASQECSNQVSEIRRHLQVYEESLRRFESRNTLKNTDGNNEKTVYGFEGHSEPQRGFESNSSPSAHSVHTTSSRMTENEVQIRTVLAYGTHVMHVLHILLEGKWDPVSLLEDEDLWISSSDFVAASGHAVAAAEAINQILEYDPGLELMPFFFGVYLLQGSFLLLLMADKLQTEASPNVVRACETIMRAHEACVVTLSTEYQRKFSKVMRSALALIRGRVPDDLGEQLQRRRELLGLYRWKGDGTGLAL
ncbi:hypothetical protein QQS21_006486 [Conoideocrella luteorostrata]|uniref:Xylanolytic transcriptional activator regulatory domain-containing protein n=1 Tax=Conoideocrella luteorostrata TaxID=1105319 RepID=A0AAJ0FTD5_9HYPO|nr:hypothetical protein QQS21_006486 [Conoideocrella luteorostrata]